VVSATSLVSIICCFIQIHGLRDSACQMLGEVPNAELPIDVTVTVDRSVQTGISHLAVGVTHMQYSLDPWGEPAAVQNGKTLLREGVRYSNQHIMGYGALNPEPRPGVYDWTSLDRRVQVARELGLIPVFTLCCAPDWMKGGAPGATDWSKIEVAPLPEHEQDFANLAGQVALRYPDVQHYLVWNEMKGMWSSTLNNWDYVRYTRLYNLVYDAVKRANPNAQIGGPYLVIEGTGSGVGFWGMSPISARNMQVIDYWLANKRGADFVVLDKPVQDPHDLHAYSDTELLSLTALFGSVTRQVRARTSLPIWWAEGYFRGSPNWDLQAAGLASMLYHELLGGTAVSLRWEPQAQPGTAYGGNDQNLFSSTLVAGGGQPYPSYYVYKAFHEQFGPGTPLYQVTVSSPDVEALASRTRTLLINKRSTETRVAVNGTVVTIGPYQVRVLESA
jgi:hypothetical protein